jgi:hypothetical protein
MLEHPSKLWAGLCRRAQTTTSRRAPAPPPPTVVVFVDVFAVLVVFVGL